MMANPYQGHPSWTYWNVSLWINNDEALYNMARGYVRLYRNRRAAADAMIEDLFAVGIERTPDGAKYSRRTIIHAMQGM